MEPYCAECGEKVPPDMDHVRVQATVKRFSDRNEHESFYFHPDCWREVSDDWVSPA